MDSPTLTYSISSNPAFSINEFSGAITLTAPLDYETTQEYVSITITATDSDGDIAVAQLEVTVLDVNDNPPIFSSQSGYSASVPEDLPVGSAVINGVSYYLT